MSSPLRQHLNWLEDRFTEVAASAEERRQRAYLTISLGAAAVAVAALGVLDFVVGDRDDALRVTLAASVLAGFLVMLRFWPRLGDITRLLMAFGVALVTYEAFIGSNHGASFLWFYTQPLTLFFILGRREAVAWSLLTAGLIAWLLFVVDLRMTDHGHLGSLALVTFGILVALGHGLQAARQRMTEALGHQGQELQRRLADVEALRGLVPICASCKRTRDDRGYWNRIETYLARHTAVDLHSALCPSCAGRDPGADRPPRLVERAVETSTADDAHQHHRRVYFTVGNLLVIPSLVGFGWHDWIAGRTTEGLLVFGHVIILTIALAMLRGGSFDRVLYHVSTFSGLAVLTHELHVGAADGYIVLWLYVYPVFTIFLFSTAGIAWTMVALAIASGYLFGPWGYDYHPAVGIRVVLTYALVAITAYVLEASRRRSHERLVDENRTLRQAIDRVQTLRGLLPICPSCTSVRDDRGFWEQIDTYMTRVSGTRFTHGLCPECAEAALAELDEHPLPTTLPLDERARA